MINLLHGDCLELMKDIPDNSIDMVLTDPPYGTTACKWDSVIPFEPMWAQLKRITKDNGAICLFGSEPFSSALRMSNIKMFKYDWVWDRVKKSGYLNSKKQPLRHTEIISTFYKKQPLYSPILTDGKRHGSGGAKKILNSEVYGNHTKIREPVSTDKYYPTTTLRFNAIKNKCHPCEKPVALLEYLIKTYTLENETVLDFTMGSGSTGVAAKNLNRKFIGIEKDDKYFNIAKARIYEDL